MATYKEIQIYVKEKYGVGLKTCWIADMKEKSGIVTRKAPNRISESERVFPCPTQHQEKIRDAFKHFHMIGSV